MTLAPGTFRGGDVIRKVLEWDARLSPAAKVRSVGAGVVVSGRTVVSERAISLTYEGIPYEEEALTVYELDEDGAIRRMRSYYDELALEHQIALRMPGVKGWLFKQMTGFLVSSGAKGLDATPVAPAAR